MRRPLTDTLLLVAVILVALGIAFVLSGCTSVRAVTQAVQAPPERFKGPAPVVYLHAGAVAQECGNPLYVSCAVPMPEGVAGPDWRIVTPDPCTYSETYARLVCHELAHANGWTREHERK